MPSFCVEHTAIPMTLFVPLKYTYIYKFFNVSINKAHFDRKKYYHTNWLIS